MGLRWYLCVFVVSFVTLHTSQAVIDEKSEKCILLWGELQETITAEDRESNFKNVNCSAKANLFKADATSHLERMVRLELQNMVRFMHIASHFGRDSVSRLGFRDYFQKLSDKAWERSVKLVKYVSKRGDQLLHKGFEIQIDPAENFYVRETESLEDLLSVQKYSNRIAAKNYKHALNTKLIDPDLAHFIQDEFIHEQTEEIRQTSGYLSNLFMMLGSSEKNLGIHMIDNMLAD